MNDELKETRLTESQAKVLMRRLSQGITPDALNYIRSYYINNPNVSDDINECARYVRPKDDASRYVYNCKLRSKIQWLEKQNNDLIKERNAWRDNYYIWLRSTFRNQDNYHTPLLYPYTSY